MKGKVAFNAVVITGVAAVTWWANGAPVPEKGTLIAVLLLVPLFAWLIWLRWDWAPAEYQRRQAEKRKREASLTRSTPPHDSTDAAERP